LIKVKAHSGVLLNEQADQLAKEACNLKKFIFINQYNKNIPNNSVLWNNDITLDKDIRQCLKSIQNNQRLNSLLNHRSLQHFKNSIVKKSIDLHWTSIWLNYSPFPAPTSSEFSKYQSYKYKYHFNMNPTCDRLASNYPGLIPELKCFMCKASQDTNHHLWRCPTARTYIHNGCRPLATDIVNKIHDLQPNNSLTSIKKYIYNLNLFNPYLLSDRNRNIRNNHPVFLLYNQLIPNSLINIFKHFKIPTKHFKQFLLNALSKFFKYLHTNIWKTRSSHFKIWKLNNNINKNSFKNYKRQPYTGNTSNTSRPRGRARTNVFNPLNCDWKHNRIEEWIRWTSSYFIHNLPWYRLIDYTDNPQHDSASP